MNNSNSSNDSKEGMISNKINLNGECERNTISFQKEYFFHILHLNLFYY